MILFSKHLFCILLCDCHFTLLLQLLQLWLLQYVADTGRQPHLLLAASASNKCLLGPETSKIYNRGNLLDIPPVVIKVYFQMTLKQQY